MERPFARPRVDFLLAASRGDWSNDPICGTQPYCHHARSDQRGCLSKHAVSSLQGYASSS